MLFFLFLKEMDKELLNIKVNMYYYQQIHSVLRCLKFGNNSSKDLMIANSE